MEKTLSKQNYVHGDRLTSLDKDYFEKLTPHSLKLSASTHPYVFAWYSFIFKFADQVKASWPKAEIQAAAAKPAGKADAKEEKPAKKVKKPVIAMSLVMLEVKPLDDTTNLDDVAKRCFKEI